MQLATGIAMRKSNTPLTQMREETMEFGIDLVQFSHIAHRPNSNTP